MSSDLAIPAVAQARPPAPRPAPAPVPAQRPAAPPSLHSNPVPGIDPALGIVVLHFYDAAGAQTSSIPTPRQLASYREHGDVVPSSPLDP